MFLLFCFYHPNIPDPPLRKNRFISKNKEKSPYFKDIWIDTIKIFWRPHLYSFIAGYETRDNIFNYSWYTATWQPAMCCSLWTKCVKCQTSASPETSTLTRLTGRGPRASVSSNINIYSCLYTTSRPLFTSRLTILINSISKPLLLLFWYILVWNLVLEIA